MTSDDEEVTTNVDLDTLVIASICNASSCKRRRRNAAANKSQNNIPPTFDNGKWRNGGHDIDHNPGVF